MIVIRARAHLSPLGISSGFTLALPDTACEIGSRLPYVLCLHDYAGDGELALRELDCENLVEASRLALLLPDGQNSCFLNMAHGPKWQAYLLDGLLPFAQRSFPLAGRPWLLGIGTGGWAASRIAALFPDRFSACAAVRSRADLPQAYALGGLGAMPDLEAAFGAPTGMQAFPVSSDTCWVSGEAAAKKALEYLIQTNGDAAR